MESSSFGSADSDAVSSTAAASTSSLVSVSKSRLPNSEVASGYAGCATGETSSNPDAVLDGDIDIFLEASLAQRIKGNGPFEVEDIG